MGRNSGSGRHNETAAAIESLVARVFEGQSADVAAERVDRDYDLGLGGVRSSQLLGPLHKIADKLGLNVVRAVTPDPDHLSDVRLELAGGDCVWIEVKAQTTGPFGRLSSADWVRDETDVLRWLLHNDNKFAGLMPDWMRQNLEVSDPDLYFEGWDLASLWIGDLALLQNRMKRRSAGVEKPSDFASFLSQKYLLHITNAGVQVIRLDAIPFVQSVLSGAPVMVDVEASRASSARVWVASGTQPQRGAFEFAYYVAYQSGVLGRHKLPERTFAGAPGLFRVNFVS
jgi:hypothetical protein